METLLLTHKEVEEILTDIAEVIEAVESAFREKGLGRVQMPAKVYLNFTKYEGDLRAMPAYLEEMDIASVKVVNSHPGNKHLHNLPTVMAVIILAEPKTGFPLAIMDGTHITKMRTGAAGGVAARYLAVRNPRKIAMIGAGTQARTQLQALMTLYKTIEQVNVYDINPDNAVKYVNEMHTLYSGVVFSIKPTVKEAVDDVDIITTTTPSRKPVVMNEWIDEGVHFNCIGADAPGKQELDPAILKRAKIVVDDYEQALHSGEVNVPVSQGILSREDIYAELGEVVAGLKKGRETDGEVTVFTSTGLAIQDAVTAYMVYSKALRIKKGTPLEIIHTEV